MKHTSSQILIAALILLLAQWASAQPVADPDDVADSPSVVLPQMLPSSSAFAWSTGTVPPGRMSVALQRSQTPPDSEEGRESGHFRPALVASAGLAVTGALLAYWSTNEAEQAYERYLHSAGASRQQDALDRAERHDRIAGAGFLLMEAGLVLTARFVFF